jgi:hypothetical protein
LTKDPDGPKKCDLCGKGGTASYSLLKSSDRLPEGARILDLCPEHAAPVDRLIWFGRPNGVSDTPSHLIAPARRPSKKPPLRRKIYTTEELDALEAEESSSRES